LEEIVEQQGETGESLQFSVIEENNGDGTGWIVGDKGVFTWEVIVEITWTIAEVYTWTLGADNTWFVFESFTW
jgi:PKD repeat protein